MDWSGDRRRRQTINRSGLMMRPTNRCKTALGADSIWLSYFDPLSRSPALESDADSQPQKAAEGALRHSNGRNMNAPRVETPRRLPIAALVAATMMCPFPAVGHDVWSNGAQVPAWIKKACCGPSEVHQLPADKVHALPDGYHVDGLATVIPYSRVLPSSDGAFWGFWNPDALNPVVFCFFAPTSRGVT
jgi:hypothetical protein